MKRKSAKDNGYLPHRRGQRGEALAIAHFEELGFSVVKKNYRYRRSEVDLIVRQTNTLVFVEVKLRKNAEYGHPESFVDVSQADRIVAAADHYVHETNWEGMIRFDVVAITLHPKLTVTHFEDAFY